MSVDCGKEERYDDQKRDELGLIVCVKKRSIWGREKWDLGFQMARCFVVGGRIDRMEMVESGNLKRKKYLLG